MQVRATNAGAVCESLGDSCGWLLAPLPSSSLLPWPRNGWSKMRPPIRPQGAGAGVVTCRLLSRHIRHTPTASWSASRAPCAAGTRSSDRIRLVAITPLPGCCKDARRICRSNILGMWGWTLMAGGCASRGCSDGAMQIHHLSGSKAPRMIRERMNASSSFRSP